MTSASLRSMEIHKTKMFCSFLDICISYDVFVCTMKPQYNIGINLVVSRCFIALTYILHIA